MYTEITGMSAEEIELVTGGALTEEEQAEIDQIEAEKSGLPVAGVTSVEGVSGDRSVASRLD